MRLYNIKMIIYNYVRGRQYSILKNIVYCIGKIFSILELWYKVELKVREVRCVVLVNYSYITGGVSE